MALVVLLLLTLFGFAVYSGLFAEVVVSAGLPPIGNITVAYKFQVGPYGDCGRLFTESCSISPKMYSIAVYYDNPRTVSHSGNALNALLLTLLVDKKKFSSDRLDLRWLIDIWKKYCKV